MGGRTKKISADTETQFLWNGHVVLNEIQLLKTVEKDESKSTEKTTTAKIYVFEPNSFKPLAQIQSNEIYYYHLYHLGTPQELTANDGSIVWRAQYKTYGNLALKIVETIENNIRFQGQYFDQETGLHYNPNTRQFIQQDPIGLLGGLNNYQYAPNPVGWIDPLGLISKYCQPIILENYNIHADRFENAILNPDPTDKLVNSSIEKLARARNVPVINASNIQDLKNVKILTFVSHGSGESFFVGGKAISGKELGNKLNALGFCPVDIEAIACQMELGPARQDLSDITGVPVLGGIGRMAVSISGSVRVVNETATRMKGDPMDMKNIVLYPEGQGRTVYRPKS